MKVLWRNLWRNLWNVFDRFLWWMVPVIYGSILGVFLGTTLASFIIDWYMP